MGDEDEDIARVFAFFRTLSNIGESLSKMTESPEAVKKIVLDIFGSQSTTSIERFFHRPWFTRRWVLQEMIIGPSNKSQLPRSANIMAFARKGIRTVCPNSRCKRWS